MILASQEVLWLRQLLMEFWFLQEHPTTLWCDNQSAIHISKNPIQHQRTKHIDIHMHFIRQLIQDGVLNLKYLPTEEQVVDIFTKPLASPRFLQLRLILGVKSLGGCLESSSFHHISWFLVSDFLSLLERNFFPQVFLLYSGYEMLYIVVVHGYLIMPSCWDVFFVFFSFLHFAYGEGGLLVLFISEELSSKESCYPQCSKAAKLY